MDALPSLSITISFAQILAFIGKWDLYWPYKINIVLSFFSFVNLNLEIAHPECNFRCVKGRVEHTCRPRTVWIDCSPCPGPSVFD